MTEIMDYDNNEWLNELWENALSFLKDELTPFVYREYFEDQITPLFIKDNTIYLQVLDEGHKILLEQQYVVLIQNAVKFYTQNNYNINFVVASSNNMIADENNLFGSQTSFPNSNSNNFDMYNNYIQFNRKFTFDSFVVGPNNRFAHAASMAVADAPGQKYNPLYIYGGVGLGKTHLLHAIAQHILKKDPTKRVILLSSEQFLNEFTEAILHKTNLQFRNKYRNADVLLIDDIQFLARAKETQNEFFHTFNTLQSLNKQIILTSDKPPKEIDNLEERLKSRFSIGLLCDISNPDFETRLAILKKKAREENYEIKPEILDFIAENVKSNIRELEGVLLKINALNDFYDTPLTIDIVKKELKDIIDINKNKISLELINNEVCNYFNISTDEILSRRRTKNIAFPRQVSMYLSREMTDNSTPSIGDFFGGRDHSTVIHGYERIKELVESDMAVKEDVGNIIVNIKNKS